jgi:ParB-like chromosome segregation protein Spo0J
MELQLALIQTSHTMPKLKRIPLSDLPATEELDLEKGQPDASFVQDLINRGQLEPITVIKLAPSKFSVIAGNKRIAAIRQINELMPDKGFDAVLAMVVNDNAEAAITGAVASNNQRHGNAITDLKGIRYLAEKYPTMGEKQIALSLGMNLQTFRRRKKLLKLNDLLLAEVMNGRITVTVAEYVADRLYLQDPVIAKLAEKKVVSMDDLKGLQRVRKQDRVDNSAQQLLPGIVPPLPADDTEQISNEIILLGVALMNDQGQIVSPVLADDDPDTEIAFNALIEGLPVGTEVFEVYIYKK